jgi:hypothetical protein
MYITNNILNLCVTSFRHKDHCTFCAKHHFHLYTLRHNDEKRKLTKHDTRYCDAVTGLRFQKYILFHAMEILYCFFHHDTLGWSGQNLQVLVEIHSIHFHTAGKFT